MIGYGLEITEYVALLKIKNYSLHKAIENEWITFKIKIILFFV